MSAHPHLHLHLHLHLQRRSRHRQDRPHLLHRQATGRVAHAPIRRGVSGLRGGQLAPRVPRLRRGLVIHQDPACGRAQEKIGPALHMLTVGRSPRDSQFDHGDGRWPAGCQPRTQSAQLVVERCAFTSSAACMRFRIAATSVLRRKPAVAGQGRPVVFARCARAAPPSSARHWQSSGRRSGWILRTASTACRTGAARWGNRRLLRAGTPMGWASRAGGHRARTRSAVHRAGSARADD